MEGHVSWAMTFYEVSGAGQSSVHRAPASAGVRAGRFGRCSGVCAQETGLAHIAEALRSHESTKARKCTGLVSCFRVFVADRSNQPGARPWYPSTGCALGWLALYCFGARPRA